MADRSVWLNALQQSLASLPGPKRSAKGQWLSFRRRNEFDLICLDVENAMKTAGSDPNDPEWQAAKSLMKTVYDRTCEAAECGYNYYQFTLGSPAFRYSLSRLLNSTDLQDGLRMWSRRLGWESADLVDWTSVALGRSTNLARPFSTRREQYTVRLQGFFAARQRDRLAEQYGLPVLRTVRERMM